MVTCRADDFSLTAEALVLTLTGSEAEGVSVTTSLFCPSYA